MILSKTARTACRVLWISVLVSCIVVYFFNRQHLTPAGIFEWINNNTQLVIISYSIICILRGLTLIPSTPFIFAGIMLMPDDPLMLLSITLGCILLSSTIIYYLSGYIGLGTYIERVHDARIQNLREKIEKNSGFYVIAIWALLPFTPTDLMVYAAGTMKLPFRRIMLPLMIGEAIICAVYIFSGSSIMHLIS